MLLNVFPAHRPDKWPTAPMWMLAFCAGTTMSGPHLPPELFDCCPSSFPLLAHSRNVDGDTPPSREGGQKMTTIGKSSRMPQTMNISSQNLVLLDLHRMSLDGTSDGNSTPDG